MLCMLAHQKCEEIELGKPKTHSSTNTAKFVVDDTQKTRNYNAMSMEVYTVSRIHLLKMR